MASCSSVRGAYGRFQSGFFPFEYNKMKSVMSPKLVRVEFLELHFLRVIHDLS